MTTSRESAPVGTLALGIKSEAVRDMASPASASGRAGSDTVATFYVVPVATFRNATHSL